MSSQIVAEKKSMVIVPNQKGGADVIPCPDPVILEEDIYTKSISSILERDFFPELPQLRLQIEWEEAIQRNDIVAINKIQEEYKKNYANRMPLGTFYMIFQKFTKF